MPFLNFLSVDHASVGVHMDKYQFPFNNGAFMVSGCCCVRFCLPALSGLLDLREKRKRPNTYFDSMFHMSTVCGFGLVTRLQA